MVSKKSSSVKKFTELIPSTQTHIARVAIKKNASLTFQDIVDRLTKAMDNSEKTSIMERNARKQNKKTSKKPKKRFEYMLNQFTFRVCLNDKIVTVMCFHNLCLTITGCKKNNHGKRAVDKILKVIPELEIINPARVVMTTIHYTIGQKLNISRLAQYLNSIKEVYSESTESTESTESNDKIKSYWDTMRLEYRPDCVSYLKLEVGDVKFIIRYTGKIMQSCNGKITKMRPLYNLLTEKLGEFIHCQM